ncbi:type II secretory pathway, component HofQ [Serpentinimonas raichei]|uniref:Type IV pilus biogenesis and competence protein PilQ n=1 Tax=Serpentinimonas raichei TaxID=1458425 RepID=A0A060NGN6_9BURK|nr:type IV pilus secretin family protein [Serpentinimonas raichei]BAO80127.1 type II secretory pathway, component HofQ [Serpentinimonas raichei]
MNPTPHTTPTLRTLSRLARCALLASTFVLAGWAQAQLAIQSLTVAPQGGAELIRIQTSEPLRQLPAGFSMQAPARIALDIAGASNATGQNLFAVNQGNVRSANVVQAGDRTRIVLNLNQAVGYEMRIEGNTLLVQLQPGVQAAPVAGGALGAAFAQAAPARAQPLTDIDFRRGEQNSGRVLVELPSSQTGVDIRQQGRNLVVEFQQSSLPEGLRRRLDVSDFGTPVQTVTATQVGDRVRLLVEPTGNWEHSAFQTDNQFVLEVREVRQAADPAARDRTFTGDKISLNFQNIEVRALLQVIADFSNFNIITSDTVTGSLTMRLRDVPWDQALDIVLQAKNLGMRSTGNVIWIAPRTEILAKEREVLEAAQAIRGLEPVRTQSFRLNFARAQEVAEHLTTAVGSGENEVRILSSQGSVFAEPRTNQLFVTDIASKLEEIQTLIQTLDVPMRQVLIEARIVEAEDSFGRNLGVRFGGRIADPVMLARHRGNELQTTLGFGSLGATGAGNSNVTNIPTPTIGSGTFAFSLFNPSVTRLLNLEIEASESDRRLKTIASPRVVTADQREATIEDGRKIPFLRRDADGNTTIEFIDASLKLVVTPQITPDGDVIMQLRVNNDTPIVFNGQTAVQTKSVQTQVLVENGGTVVIGGIYTQEETNNQARVPVLGELPVLGHLFRNNQTTTRRTELLVFITPRVLTDIAALGPRR